MAIHEPHFKGFFDIKQISSFLREIFARSKEYEHVFEILQGEIDDLDNPKLLRCAGIKRPCPAYQVTFRHMPLNSKRLTIFEATDRLFGISLDFQSNKCMLSVGQFDSAGKQLGFGLRIIYEANMKIYNLNEGVFKQDILTQGLALSMNMINDQSAHCSFQHHQSLARIRMR